MMRLGKQNVGAGTDRDKMSKSVSVSKSVSKSEFDTNTTPSVKKAVGTGPRACPFSISNPIPISNRLGDQAVMAPAYQKRDGVWGTSGQTHRFAPTNWNGVDHVVVGADLRVRPSMWFAGRLKAAFLTQLRLTASLSQVRKDLN